MSGFIVCRFPVANRGSAPESFLTELVTWAKSAPTEVFEVKPGNDIYTEVANQLGPYPEGDMLLRKAVMLEILRVLAGFESSWSWTEGVDTTNSNSNKACTMEAGAFQCSGDSMNFDPSLKSLVREVAGTVECIKFQEVTKTNHPFAIEYCARLLRFTTKHHGPIKDHEIHEWLNRNAVMEFETALKA
ncbi:hypothetical protein [Polaromonas sp.]|uniref:hypothetical protein n=1 Tax=Polaromonas sp. TaxID=1869339 RepID=UPI003BABA3DC